MSTAQAQTLLQLAYAEHFDAKGQSVARISDAAVERVIMGKKPKKPIMLENIDAFFGPTIPHEYKPGNGTEGYTEFAVGPVCNMAGEPYHIPPGGNVHAKMIEQIFPDKKQYPSHQ